MLYLILYNERVLHSSLCPDQIQLYNVVASSDANECTGMTFVLLDLQTIYMYIA